MNKTLEQFLSQFYFISMEECRRVVIKNGVMINDYVVKLSDLDKNCCEYVKTGDQLKIRNQEWFGYKSFLVKRYHL